MVSDQAEKCSNCGMPVREMPEIKAKREAEYAKRQIAYDNATRYCEECRYRETTTRWGMRMEHIETTCKKSYKIFFAYLYEENCPAVKNICRSENPKQALQEQKEIDLREERERKECERKEREEQEARERPEKQRQAEFEKLKIAEGTADFCTVLNSDDTVTITGYKVKIADIVIPSTIGGKPVTAVDSFRNDIESIVFPDSVRRIRKSALSCTWAYDYKLRKITIGSNVSVEVTEYDNEYEEQSFPWYYYHKGNSNAGTYIKRGGSEGHWAKRGCFITTAVCESFGKADDCRELMLFRAFRDNWLKRQNDGEALIEEYYRIAPGIVAEIDSQENRSVVYRSIWDNYLADCLKMINAGDFDGCKQRYVAMVKNLSKQYQVLLS
jgi:hypothetical protein